MSEDGTVGKVVDVYVYLIVDLKGSEIPYVNVSLWTAMPLWCIWVLYEQRRCVDWKNLPAHAEDATTSILDVLKAVATANESAAVHAALWPWKLNLGTAQALHGTGCL